MNDRLLNIKHIGVMFDLALRVDIETLTNFFEAYPEFDYLLKDTHFMEQLAIVHDVPYSNNLLNLINYSHMNLSDKLHEAVRNNDYDSVVRMIDLDTNKTQLTIVDINKAMYSAAIRGNENIVKLMLSLGANNFNQVSWIAASHDDIELLKLMVEADISDTIDYDSILYEVSYHKRGSGIPIENYLQEIGKYRDITDDL